MTPQERRMGRPDRVHIPAPWWYLLAALAGVGLFAWAADKLLRAWMAHQGIQ